MDSIIRNNDEIYDIYISNRNTGELVFQACTDALIIIANDTHSNGMHAAKMLNCDGITVCNIIHAMSEMQKIFRKKYPLEYMAAKLNETSRDD